MTRGDQTNMRPFNDWSSLVPLFRRSPILKFEVMTLSRTFVCLFFFFIYINITFWEIFSYIIVDITKDLGNRIKTSLARLSKWLENVFFFIETHLRALFLRIPLSLSLSRFGLVRSFTTYSMDLIHETTTVAYTHHLRCNRLHITPISEASSLSEKTEHLRSFTTWPDPAWPVNRQLNPPDPPDLPTH